MTTQKMKHYFSIPQFKRLLSHVPKIKRYLPYSPYLVVFWAAMKAGEAYRMAPGKNLFQKIISTVSCLNKSFGKPLPSLVSFDWICGVIGVLAVYLLLYSKKKKAKKFRHGVEYGSARWGTPADIEPYINPVFSENVLLSQTERLTMEERPKKPKYARNKNVLVIGGSGSGKTRFFVKPNLMQMHSSYVITDPKGTILIECGRMLQRGIPKIGKDGKPVKDKNGKTVYEPYEIKVLNTIDFSQSNKYNPFAYIRSEKDILKFVTALLSNTKGEGGQSKEDFWVKAERLLYCALIGYIYYEAEPEEKNMNTLVEMINQMEVRENDETYKNVVDYLFDELEEENPRHFAVRQYKKYKLAAGKTAKSILISCGARLAPFDIEEIRELMSTDELELDLLGERRTAFFVIISDNDTTFNFIVALMYSQMFNLLCDRADFKHKGRLPIHVRCILDEFANIGQIPQFEKLIATIRSRRISACIILQAQSQLKGNYKDHADTIVGNCDTTLFLGGKEKTTLDDMVKALGKETIDSINTSVSKGNTPSYGKNYQKLGKELMSRDELETMDGGQCILQLRGVRPFKSEKYDITGHKNYRLLSDENPKNEFDIAKYLKRHAYVSASTKKEMRREYESGSLYEVDYDAS